MYVDTFLRSLYRNHASVECHPIRIINNHIVLTIARKSLRKYTAIIDGANMRKMRLLIVGACRIKSRRDLWSHEESHLSNCNFLSNPNIEKDL